MTHSKNESARVGGNQAPPRERLNVQITEKDGVVTFLVRAQPRASRDEIAGEWQNALKIRLTAPAVEDRANEALCRFLASRLKVPVAAVRIAAGQRSRTKRVEIRGVSEKSLRELCALRVKSGDD